MATAPEFFDHAALLEIESPPVATDEIRDSRRAITKMILLGATGTALAVASLFLVAAADSRLSDEAFIRVFGWF